MAGDGGDVVGDEWATIVEVGAKVVYGGAIVGDKGVMVDDEGVVGNVMVGDGDGGVVVADGGAIRQQILLLSPIPKATPRARNRQAQVAQLLTGSPYKDALAEKVRLRGVGRRGASKGRTAGRGRRQSSTGKNTGWHYNTCTGPPNTWRFHGRKLQIKSGSGMHVHLLP